VQLFDTKVARMSSTLQRLQALRTRQPANSVFQTTMKTTMNYKFMTDMTRYDVMKEVMCVLARRQLPSIIRLQLFDSNCPPPATPHTLTHILTVCKIG